MIDYSFSNIKTPEVYVRMCIATVMLFYSVMYGFISFTILSLLLYHTAYKRYCFVYPFFNINKKYSFDNYYLSFIPKHSSSEVIIFSLQGKLLFRNNTAEKGLINIRSIIDICDIDHKAIILGNKTKKGHYKCTDHEYKVEFKGIAEEELLLVYFFDISEIINLNAEIEKTQSEVIYTMGGIGESRSKETGNHVKRVALYSEKLALLCGLSVTEASLLKMASPMHDIGKVAIPDSILNAPRRLSDEEFEIMKNHTSLGYEMLKNSNQKIFHAAAIVAYEHHEKFDGTGYPRRLAGENIHIFGRITAIVDVFDALISERVYKKPWGLSEIIALFHEEKGKQFDPELVKIFILNIDLFIKIQQKYSE